LASELNAAEILKWTKGNEMFNKPGRCIHDKGEWGQSWQARTNRCQTGRGTLRGRRSCTKFFSKSPDVEDS